MPASARTPLGQTHVLPTPRNDLTMTDALELWRLRRELGLRLREKRVLYLDLAYWGSFCDVGLGSARDPRAPDALAALRSAVRAGHVVCPIEFTVFAELTK